MGENKKILFQPWHEDYKELLFKYERMAQRNKNLKKEILLKDIKLKSQQKIKWLIKQFFKGEFFEVLKQNTILEHEIVRLSNEIKKVEQELQKIVVQLSNMEKLNPGIEEEIFGAERKS